MNWLAIGAGVLGAWVLLLILSGERRRRVNDLAREIEQAAKAAPETVHEIR